MSRLTPHRIDSRSTPRPALRRRAPRRVASSVGPEVQASGQTENELPRFPANRESQPMSEPRLPSGISSDPESLPPEAWLRLHATELISRLQAWTIELDDREAKLDDRESRLDRRGRATARQRWQRRMRTSRSRSA